MNTITIMVNGQPRLRGKFSVSDIPRLIAAIADAWPQLTAFGRVAIIADGPSHIAHVLARN